MTIKIIIIIILIIIRLIIIKLLKIKLKLVVIFKTVIIIQTYHNIKIIIGDICSAKISWLLAVLEVVSQQSMLHEIFSPHFVKVQILRIQRLTIVVFVKPKTDYASLLENKLASKNRTLPSSEKNDH